LNNFLCDTVGATFNKEDPIDSSTVFEETIVFDSHYAITNVSANVGETVIEAFDNGSGFVFDSTDFIGAVKAGETAWYAEWAIPGSVQ
jgi:hypothetical protein